MPAGTETSRSSLSLRFRGRVAALAAAGALAVGVVACRSPFDEPQAEQRLLQRTLSDAIDRELSNLPRADERLETAAPPDDVEATLAERRDELDAMGPAPPSRAMRFLDDVGSLGPDLTGGEQQAAALTLETAIGSAVRHNLGVQNSRLQPAINEADVVAAEAVFDALLFADASFTKTDEPATVPVLNAIPLGTPFSANDRYRFQTGVRKRLHSGAELTASSELTRSENRTPGFSLSPDPAYTARMRLGLTQPLLRGFGSAVNTATIRLSRNAERRSIQQLRADLLRVVADTEGAYWDLVLAWRELSIRRWLVEVGTEVREKLESRRDFDTTIAQFADAVARVAQREADVIRARRQVRTTSDRLKVLVNDPERTVGSEIVFAPLDDMVTAPIAYSLRDAIVTGMGHRPEIQQAILDIDDASIRELLADDQRLPLLNLNAEVTWTGLDGEAGDAYEALGDEFVNYLVALALEIPVGNRAAEAGFRRARLQRSASVIAYRRAVQDVVADVKTALRGVLSTYELIQATRSFRVAQAENLRALLAEEETLASLTPEFLNLKFQQQELLAVARLDEVRALVNFDQSVADLHRAMGIGLAANRIELEIVE